MVQSAWHLDSTEEELVIEVLANRALREQIEGIADRRARHFEGRHCVRN